MEKFRLRVEHPGGKVTYSCVPFNSKKNANKFAKRNKNVLKKCIVSVVKTRNQDITRMLDRRISI